MAPRSRTSRTTRRRSPRSPKRRGTPARPFFDRAAAEATSHDVFLAMEGDADTGGAGAGMHLRFAQSAARAHRRQDPRLSAPSAHQPRPRPAGRLASAPRRRHRFRGARAADQRRRRHPQRAAQGQYRLYRPRHRRQCRQADTARQERHREGPPDPGVGDRGHAALHLCDGQVSAAFAEDKVKEITQNAIQQSIEIVRRRVDETGTREPTIQRQGTDQILVQLPGLQDPERIKSLLGKTAKMTFRLVDQTVSPEDPNIPSTSEILPLATPRPGEAPSYVVQKRVMVSGENLTDAQATYQDAQPGVSFKFDSIGARRFCDATKNNFGKPFAIVLDNKVISAPVIRDAICGGAGVISGNFTIQSAQDLALLLRAGALPAPLKIIEERSVGPDLGADSIRAGLYAAA